MNDVDVQLLLGLAVLGLSLAALGSAWSWCRRGSVPARALLRPDRPRRVGPYVLGRCLGQGSMGVVYHARHAGTGQPCALELLPQGAGERERRQFDTEIRCASGLRHPNTAEVYEAGTAADGTRFFAMELLLGSNLDQLVEREGPQPASRVIQIMMEVCAAFATVHTQGLVHRDIKPSNILLSRAADGRDAIKLVDFGLAKHVADPAVSADAISADAAETVVGTPLYISPEAITSPEAVDGRSDLYGLGAVAYFLLSGAPVFGGQTVIEVCTQHLLSPPEPLFNVVGWSMSADLEVLVMACLAKDPAARPASAEELARRLARCADAEGRSALARVLPAGPDPVTVLLQTSV